MQQKQLRYEEISEVIKKQKKNLMCSEFKLRKLNDSAFKVINIDSKYKLNGVIFISANGNLCMNTLFNTGYVHLLPVETSRTTFLSEGNYRHYTNYISMMCRKMTTHDNEKLASNGYMKICESESIYTYNDKTKINDAYKNYAYDITDRIRIYNLNTQIEIPFDEPSKESIERSFLATNFSKFISAGENETLKIERVKQWYLMSKEQQLNI